MGREYKNIVLAPNTTGTGKGTKDVNMEDSYIPTEKSILGNGEMIVVTGMERIYGRMDIDMRDHGGTVNATDRG